MSRNSFPQEGSGYSYDFHNNKLSIKGNLAVTSLLGEVIGYDVVQIDAYTTLRKVKNNWMLTYTRDYPYSSITSDGGINTLYTQIAQHLYSTKRDLMNLHKQDILDLYWSRITNSHENNE